jgi:hypothetical protein
MSIAVKDPTVGDRVAFAPSPRNTFTLHELKIQAAAITATANKCFAIVSIISNVNIGYWQECIAKLK